MAPDPPRVGDECLSAVNSEMLTMAIVSDDSDENDNNDDTISSQGYMLFTSAFDDNFDYSAIDHYDGNEDDDDNDDINQQSEQSVEDDCVTRTGDSLTTSVIVSPGSSSCLHGNENVINKEEKESGEENAKPRTEMIIDCDQVKAAMIGFTLPPSAIPPWAAGVSDQDISSHVNRILFKNVNNNNNNSSNCK